MRRHRLVCVALVLVAAGRASAVPQGKVTICHIPPGHPEQAHTLVVSESALKAHLAHGDRLGACDATGGTTSVGAAGGSVELGGIGSVLFAPGALTTTTDVTLEMTRDAATDTTYHEYQALFQSPFRAPFELHLILASQQPSLPCSARVVLPAALRDSLPLDLQPTVFVAARAGSEEDTLEFVNELESQVVGGEIRFELPIYCFDRSTSADGRIAARFFLAAGPARALTPAERLGLEGEYLTTSPTCEGGLLGLPFGVDPTHACVTGDVGPCVYSAFGPRIFDGVLEEHPGVDFRAPLETPIIATSDGVVDVIGMSDRGAGNRIILRHTLEGRTSDGVTIYMHMDKFATGLKVGSQVVKGQIIGFVGSTGRSTGNHLHLGYVPNGHFFNEKGLRNPLPCIVQSPPLFDLGFGTADHACNLINGSCPSPGCMRAGREYDVVLSARLGSAPPPAGTTVAFSVNGKSLGAPVPMIQGNALSDHSFLGAPFRPAPGTRIRLDAEVRMPGLPTEFVVKNVPIIFDDAVLVKNGHWRLHANQVKRRGVFNRYVEATCGLDVDFTVVDCVPQGSVVVTISGVVVNQGSACAVPAQTKSCSVGDCLSLDFGRRSLSFSGAIGLPFGACGTGAFGPDMCLPPNFTYDLITGGSQQSGDGQVTVTYGGGASIVFSRAWDVPFGLNERETGTATVTLERVDATSPLPAPSAMSSGAPNYSGGRAQEVGPDGFGSARPARGAPRLSWSTTPGQVRFEISSGQDAVGSLIIYDALGRRVRVLRLGRLEPGRTSMAWDGTSDAGVQVPSGVYFARLVGAQRQLDRTRFVWIR